MARTLQEWEAYITPLFKRVRLLGEIPINQAEFEAINEEIRVLIARTPNIHEATRRLHDHWPITFATFLAHFASHNTHRDFWEALGDRIGSNAGDLSRAKWGRNFISILEENRKPTFEDVGGVTRKYVTSIRVHGGIPAYSLDDFFSNMLMPSIERPDYISLQGEELVDALLRRSSVQFFTDTIVRNYFENTGEIGIQFLENCRRMARHYQKEQLILPDLDLPVYVTEAFLTFMERQQDERVHLKRPRLIFDENEGVLLDLPEQSLSGVVVSTIREAFWHIETDEAPQGRDERVRIHKQGRDNVTEGRQVHLPPVPHVHASFQIQGEETSQPRQLRRWTLSLLPAQGQPPLLLFRRQDSSLLRWVQSLPAEELLLLFPTGTLIEPIGNSRVLHRPDSLSAGWRTWRAEYWSLEPGFMRLLRKEQEIALVPIQGRATVPQLIGVEPFAQNIDPKGVPLFIGNIPHLRIPVRATRIEDRKRWAIDISSQNEADPPIRIETSLDKLADYIHQEDEFLDLDLHALFGETPTGTYSLCVRDSLDVDIELHLRLWGQLEVRDLPDIILPAGRTGEQTVSLSFGISLPPSTSCEPQAGSAGIAIKGNAGRYRVDIEDDITRADLQLVKTEKDQVIRVPWFVPIPRLQWRLVMGDEQVVAWTTSSIKRSVDTFLQTAQSAPINLLVRLHNIERIARQMQIYLVDSDQPERVLQSDFKLERGPLGEGHGRFILNAHDTLRGHPEVSVFEFQLGIPDPKTWNETRVPLLTLARTLEISNVHLETTSESEAVCWDEPRPLKNRRIFICSPWQPWEKGWDIRIPDSVRGRFDILSAGYALPESRYEMYFYVAAEWEPERTSPPHQACVIVDTVDPSAHLAWLSERIQKDAMHAFRWHFEQACVFESLGESERREEAINKSFQLIDQANLVHLLAFHDWLGDYDPSTQKAVRMKLYRPERLTRLFAETMPHDPFRHRYLQHVTSIKIIPPETALILIRSTDDALIVMHSLRSLVSAHSPQSLEIIIPLLRKGQISYSDSADILALEMDFYFGILAANATSPEHLRLFSALIQRREDRISILAGLSNDRLSALAKADNSVDAAKPYLTQLIRNEDTHGIELVMLMFQEGRLLGGEVTEILGSNPKFSYQILNNNPADHAHQIQATELLRKYPAALGFVTPGMYVKTPAGWALVESMTDAKGHVLEVVPAREPVIYNLRLHPLVDPEPAILDMNARELVFPGEKKLLRCAKCDAFMTSSDIALKNHNRREHQGINLSFAPVAPRVSLVNDPEFRENLE